MGEQPFHCRYVGSGLLGNRRRAKAAVELTDRLGLNLEHRHDLRVHEPSGRQSGSEIGFGFPLLLVAETKIN